MTTPQFLKKRDVVVLFCSARKNIEDNLQPAIKLLEDWGLEVIIDKTNGLQHNQLAGKDEERASHFQKQLDDPRVKAIWIVRGGYGTVRIIDVVDFQSFMKTPKWIVGFSDITVFHNHLNVLRYSSIHSIMCINVSTATEEAKESLRKALFGEKLEYHIKPHHLNRLGKSTGELVGGNLSIIYSLLGSESAIDCNNKILFLEDLDEYLYHIDRMMMNLKRNNYFKNIKGIIIGSMTEMKDNDNNPWGKNAYEIISEITQELDIPILFDFPAGHIPDNRALILGKTISLEVRADGGTIFFH